MLAQIVFYEANGRTLQTFDYSNDDGVREFTACAFNPSGDAVAFGTYNRFYVYVHNANRNVWEQVSIIRGFVWNYFSCRSSGTKEAAS